MNWTNLITYTDTSELMTDWHIECLTTTVFLPSSFPAILISLTNFKILLTKILVQDLSDLSRTKCTRSDDFIQRLFPSRSHDLPFYLVKKLQRILLLKSRFLWFTMIPCWLPCSLIFSASCFSWFEYEKKFCNLCIGFCCMATCVECLLIFFPLSVLRPWYTQF